jgi:hypothetical protein
MPNLTRRFIESLGRDPSKRDVTHWDDGLSGFGLRVRASGAMSWIIMYRNRDGRLRKYTIGQLGALTPDQARKEARLKLAAVYQGADPSSDKNAQRKALTVSELCDRYQEYSRDRIKPSTWKMNASRIECHVKPLLGKRKAVSLKIEDIENLQRDVAAGASGKPSKRVGRGGTARGGKGVADHPRFIERSLHRQNCRLARLQHRIQAPKDSHRQDYVAVFATHVEVPQDVVSDAPNKVGQPIEIAVAHSPQPHANAVYSVPRRKFH